MQLSPAVELPWLPSVPELSGGRVATAEGAGHLQSGGGIGKDEMTLFIMEVSKDQSPSWIPHRTVFQTQTTNCDPFDPT